MPTWVLANFQAAKISNSNTRENQKAVKLGKSLACSKCQGDGLDPRGLIPTDGNLHEPHAAMGPMLMLILVLVLVLVLARRVVRIAIDANNEPFRGNVG